MSQALLLMMFSVLIPSKMWYGPTAPLNVTAEGDVVLVLTDFTGKVIEPKGSADAAAGKAVDVRGVFPQLSTAGAYVLYAVPKGKQFPEFVGTPIVITVRDDKRSREEGPVVVKMEPLRYMTLSTDAGDMTWIFWYDVAPNTVAHIQSLAEQGYYDGVSFHRILPGFVVQGGDPRGDGLGGPGFQIDAEFSERKHELGVLSMARVGDPDERMGRMPRCEFANSAGSQFFICLGNLTNLDSKYTGFGKVVEGIETVNALAKTPLADAQAGKPVKAPIIKKAEVKRVTADKNPYAAMMGLKK